MDHIDGAWSRWGSETFSWTRDQPKQYLSWAERVFAFNATLAKLYLHTHHTTVDDFWVVSASASQLHLDQQPWLHTAEAFPTELSAHGYSTKTAMLHVLSRLERLQEKCTMQQCEWDPRLRCISNQDLWERAPVLSRPRYRLPKYSGDWQPREGHPFVFMTFHRPPLPLDRNEVMYTHTTLYIWVIPVTETSITYTTAWPTKIPEPAYFQLN